MTKLISFVWAAGVLVKGCMFDMHAVYHFFPSILGFKYGNYFIYTLYFKRDTIAQLDNANEQKQTDPMERKDCVEFFVFVYKE